MTNEDAVHRGKALYVAEFLSTFQAFFRRNDAERKGPVSVELIERALSYRQLLLDHCSLENEFAMHRKDGILTDKQIEAWEQRVAESKATIESSPANVKAVHELIQRFEVWMTQSLANHVLTYCVKASPGNGKDKLSICCSPVLNTPGAAYVMALMSQQGSQNSDGKQHVCGVGVPANAWTWQEYLRICNMVSCLDKREDVMKSTLTAASQTLVGERKEELKLSEKNELTPADLVALWTRSQRNTSALLHFLKLFKVSEAPEEPRQERYNIRASAQCRGKMLVVEEAESDSEEEAEPRYIAEYVGNHKKTRNYVLKCSTLLDKLVEWAIANQALFTYRYIRESLSKTSVSEKNSSSKKRPHPEEDAMGEIATKKRKRIHCEDEEELLQACQCYILRWFARRNRKVASILFSSKVGQLPLFPYESIVAELEEANVPNKVKKDLKQKYKSTNRTFSRIDRRLRLRNFVDEEDPDKTFHGAVVLLLKFLAKEVTTSEQITESEVLGACEDFEKLHDMFLGAKTASESAELLLEPTEDFDGNPAELLLAFREPYLDHCFTCAKALDEEDGGSFECDNCGKLFHNKCQPNASVGSMKELIQSYRPLARVNKAISDEMKPTNEESWRCSECQVKKPRPTSSEQRIFTESRWCKALIRDLGMESYSLSFHNEEETGRHVSLRRLDAMMEHISLKHDPSLSEMSREEKLKSLGNPYVYPSNTKQPELHPIEWVTEGMKKEPMQLLCKGIELLMLDSDEDTAHSKVDCAAFLRRFTSQFCTWFLTDCGKREAMQPSGSVLHTLMARPPWTKDSCIVCSARPVLAIDPEMPVCDNICCQQIHCAAKDKQSHEAMHVSSSGIDKLVSKYDELSSFVGSPLIVLPGDPMLQFVAKELNTSIDHMDRPVLFFVASYLPREFAKSDPRSSMLDDEGVFHVLPVILGSQLKYLYDATRMRQTPESYTDDDSWTKLDMLNVEGVVRMSAVELRRKLKETAAIRDAIDSALEGLVCSLPVGHSLDTESLANNEQGTSSTRQTGSFGTASNSISSHSTLVDCLLRSQTPIVRKMIGMLQPAPTDNDNDSTDIEEIFNEAGVAQDVDHSDSALYEGSEDMAIPGEQSESKDESSDDVYTELEADSPEVEIIGTIPPNTAISSPNDRHDVAKTFDRQMAAEPPPVPMHPRQSNVQQSRVAQNVGPVEPMRPLNAFPSSPNRQNTSLLPKQSLTPNRQNTALSPMHVNRNMLSNAANDIAQPSVVNGISRRDLYRPGLSFLTRVETAVYLEAVSRGLHNLGLRLLCPRYNLPLLRQHVGEFVRGDSSRIPRVQEQLWDYIVQRDYHRANQEEGEPILADTNAEGTFKYCIPFIPLPLDRATEEFFAVMDRQNANERQLRIRGGGPSDEGLFEIQQDSDDDDSRMHPGADEDEIVIQGGAIQPDMVNEPTALVETPRASWPGTRVYASIITTFFGQNEEEVTCLGVVQEVEPENGENVRVAVFHFSNTGYIPEAAPLPLPVASLFVIQEGSNEATIANQWEGIDRLRIPRRVSEDRMDVNDDSPSEDNEATADFDIQQDTQADSLGLQEDSSSPQVPTDQSRSHVDVDGSSKRSHLQDDSLTSSVSAATSCPGDSCNLDNATALENGADETINASETQAPLQNEEMEVEVDDETQSGIHFVDALADTPRNENEVAEATASDKGADETTNTAETLVTLQNEEMEVDDETQSDTLADISRDMWVNTLVFSDVLIEGEVAKVIGIVLKRHDLDEQIGGDSDQVTLSIFHLSNIGYFDEAREYTLPVTSVCIVQEGSSEARIAKQWEGLESLIGNTQRMAPSKPIDQGHSGRDDQTLSEIVSPLLRSERGQTTLYNSTSSQKTLSDMEDVAKSFVKTLCQRRGATPIGRLPDGRAILWLQSDPRALYIRMHTERQDDASAPVGNESEEQLSCPWRCCDRNDQELLRFETQISLQEHLRIRHDFGQIQDYAVDVENIGRLYRIQEGRMVVSLSVQLSSAICSYSSDLSELLDTSSSKAGTFRIGEVLKVDPEGRCSPQKRIVDALLHKPETYLWESWSAIARLFAVESTGLFRATTDDCETVLYITDEEEPRRLFDKGSHEVSPDEENGCVNAVMTSASPFETSSCHLCRSRWDFQWEFNDRVGLPQTRGVGCNMLSLSCRASNVLPESIPTLGTCGPPGVAKSMLIRIAASVPIQLRRRAIDKDGTTAASPTNEGLLWEEGNYQNWRFLVERSNMVRPLLQALVVLVHSLHISKLPKWWGGTKEGWASAVATMASAQYGYSALYLRLYALDAAISEYMILGSFNYMGDNAPSVLRRIPTTEGRMEVVEQWANACDYARCEDGHKSECTVCKDGGDLLCCEFCSNTQHPGCCLPIITDASKLKIWACPLCVADLSVYVGVEDDDS